MVQYTNLLKLADHLFDDMISGDKRVTIRQGVRNINATAPLIFEATNGTRDSVTVRVLGIHICPLSEVTDSELLGDGFESTQDLVEGMQEFYPDITEASTVTVVTFEVC